MEACRLPDIDVYVLQRMCDYTGHLTRLVLDMPAHLTGIMMRFRNAEHMDAMTAVVGHQGHPGRFAPWSWERQYAAFFRSKGLTWTDVAIEKERWYSYRHEWLHFAMGSRAAGAKYGNL